MYMLLFIFSLLFIWFTVEHLCRIQRKSLLEVMNPNWFVDVTKFPEYAFPCKKNHEHYKLSIEHGKKIIKEKTVIIAGLCINIEKKVDKLFKRVEQIGSLFKSYKFIVFENDSTDNTRELLINNNAILVPCEEDKNCKLKKRRAGEHGTLSRGRMIKMTEYRNRLLNFINDNYSDYDVVCFMDLDLDGPIDIRGVEHSFSYYDSWDTISSYGLDGPTSRLGIPSYYDALAFKRSNNFIKNLGMLVYTISYSVGDFPYKVLSGFGGMAFYKMDVLHNINYTPDDDNYICEHITLHKNMIKNGFDRIYINPNMIILVGTQGDTDMFPLY